MHLEIEPVIAAGEGISARIARELPTHPGLARDAAGIVAAARKARDASRAMRRLFSFHRLPVLFLAVSLLALGGWSYWRFLHVSSLKIAISNRDAVEIHERITSRGRVRLQSIATEGSRESLRLLAAREVDLAFVQGGLELPADGVSLEIPGGETVLWMLAPQVERLAQVRTILTSVEGQGSHTVCDDFVKIWGLPSVRYVHAWDQWTPEQPAAALSAAGVDAVFVVKDLANPATYRAVARLHQAGFRFEAPRLGVRFKTLDYLQPAMLQAGDLVVDPPMPAEPLATYNVATYLVARPGLTPRLLAEAGHLLDSSSDAFRQQAFEPNLQQAGDVFQSIEALLGIFVYIGVAFLTLLGLEIALYRQRFNELNTLVSLLSMRQSNKDVLHVLPGAALRDNLAYLSTCSDLLGLISVITGYYAQENPSLMYNRMMEIIQHRSSSLKLNIQLKILHASLRPALLTAGAEPAASPAPPAVTEGGGE